MSQPCGGLSSVGRRRKLTFPQVRALSNVRSCHREPTSAGLYVPTLCPPQDLLESAATACKSSRASALTCQANPV